VFRPDGSAQRLRTGERLPAHATALGKLLLAHAPVAARQLRGSALTRYTSRTLTVPSHLADALVAARQDGYASENAEHVPDQGSVAAPIRGPGGLVVGALAVLGPLERVLDARHWPRRRVLDGTLHAASAVSDALVELWGDSP
jgi:DNA-binding IclR family transcriptional regulator